MAVLRNPRCARGFRNPSGSAGKQVGKHAYGLQPILDARVRPGDDAGVENFSTGAASWVRSRWTVLSGTRSASARELVRIAAGGVDRTAGAASARLVICVAS